MLEALLGKHDNLRIVDFIEEELIPVVALAERKYAVADNDQRRSGF